MFKFSKFLFCGGVVTHAVQMDAANSLSEMKDGAEISGEQKFTDILSRLQQLEATAEAQKTRIDKQEASAKTQQKTIDAQASEIASLKNNIHDQNQANELMGLEIASHHNRINNCASAIKFRTTLIAALQKTTTSQDKRIGAQEDTTKAQQKIIEAQASEIALLKSVRDCVLEAQNKAKEMMELKIASNEKELTRSGRISKPPKRFVKTIVVKKDNRLISKTIVRSLKKDVVKTVKRTDQCLASSEKTSNSNALTLQQHMEKVNGFLARLRKLSCASEGYRVSQLKQMTTADVSESDPWKRAVPRLNFLQRQINSIFNMIAASVYDPFWSSFESDPAFKRAFWTRMITRRRKTCSVVTASQQQAKRKIPEQSTATAS